MGYVTKWLIIEEFSIFLNHRILSEKWVGMLQIIQMTHPFPKEYPVSHKNDYIFGEKPIVRTRKTTSDEKVVVSTLRDDANP